MGQLSSDTCRPVELCDVSGSQAVRCIFSDTTKMTSWLVVTASTLIFPLCRLQRLLDWSRPHKKPNRHQFFYTTPNQSRTGRTVTLPNSVQECSFCANSANTESQHSMGTDLQSCTLPFNYCK
jgi:hypothetical protein